MTFRGRVVPIMPTRGLNNAKDPTRIEDDQSPDCQNVRFRFDSIKKRDGFTRYISTATTAAAVTGIAQLSKSDGTTSQMVTAGNDAFRENAGAWTSIKGAVTLTAGQENRFQFAQLNDLVCMTNGVDQLLKWAGGSNNLAALGGSPPSAAGCLTTYKNFLILGNTTEGGTQVRERVRWSDLNAPETWPAANTNTFLNKQGQTCKGFGLVGDQLYVFFDQSIQQMSYTGDNVTPFIFPTITPYIGAASANAIVSVDWGVFFAGYRGIYFFDGSKATYISEPIETTWRSVSATNQKSIVGLHNPLFNEVWFAIRTGASSTNNLLVVYDYVREAWSLFQGINANAFGTFLSTIPLNPIFGDYSGFAMKTNSGAFLDDAAAISAYCVTKPQDFGDGGRRRKVRRLELVTNAESVAGSTVTVLTGYDLTPPSTVSTASTVTQGAIWNTDLWDQGTWAFEGQKIVYVRPPGHGRYFQAKVSNSTASQGLTVAQLLAWVIGEGNPSDMWSANDR